MAAGQPAAMVHEAVSQEVCQELNYLARGSDAVREKIDPSRAAQCFGPASGPFTYVVGVPADPDALASLARAVEEYNDAHVSAPLPMATDASPENPVTVPETRSASQAAGPGAPGAAAGVTLALGAFAPQASVATGDGGAWLRAQVPLSINGALSVPLTLQRPVSAANLVQVASAAAWSAGPDALAGLTLQGVSYAQGAWLKAGGPESSGGWRHYGLSGWACSSATSGCELEQAMEAAMNGYFGPGYYVITSVDAPRLISGGGEWHIEYYYDRLDHNKNVTGSGRQGVYRPATPGETFPSQSATVAGLEQAVQQALAAHPSEAGAVLDAALTVAAGAAQLQLGALSVSGPATAGEGAALYELEYLDDTVSVSDGDTSASATVLWP